MQPATIGTAGPAGHGKTALVRALSGLPLHDEAAGPEPAVELGFGFHDVGGRRFGVVDLPGTARLVRSLIADAHGIDLVLLVVAADAGVVPQTEECVDILHLLDARELVFVLTKIDLVDDARVAEVRTQIATLAHDSRFAEAPVHAVSSATGAGIGALRDELHRRTASATPRASSGWFRMFVDRSFHAPGRGLTVTGTVLAGRVRTGDAVALRPGGAAGDVTTLQVHGETVGEAGVGRRVAVRLGDSERKQVRRGVVLADPHVEFATDRVDCWLEVRPSARQPLRSFERVEVDVGTVETAGSVVVLAPGDLLAPRSAGFCQVVLEREMILAHGDRFVLRPAGGTRTTAGGIVLHPFAVRHASGERDLQERLERLRSPALAGRLLAFHELLPEIAAPVGYAAQALGGTDDDVRRAAAGIPDLLPLPAERPVAYALRERWTKLVASVTDSLTRLHRAHPAERGVDPETLRSRLRVPVPPRLLDAVIARLIGDGVLVADGDLLRLPMHAPRVPVSPPETAPRPRAAEPAPRPGAESADDPAVRVRRALESGGATPPDFRQLAEATALAPERIAAILADLARRGEVVLVSGDVAFALDAYERARQQLVDHLATAPEITMGEYRTLIGSSRKYALALLEHFDREGLTVRVGDARRLRK